MAPKTCLLKREGENGHAQACGSIYRCAQARVAQEYRTFLALTRTSVRPAEHSDVSLGIFSTKFAGGLARPFLAKRIRVHMIFASKSGRKAHAWKKLPSASQLTHLVSPASFPKKPAYAHIVLAGLRRSLWVATPEPSWLQSGTASQSATSGCVRARQGGAPGLHGVHSLAVPPSDAVPAGQISQVGPGGS